MSFGKPVGLRYVVVWAALAHDKLKDEYDVDFLSTFMPRKITLQSRSVPGARTLRRHTEVCLERGWVAPTYILPGLWNPY